MKPTNKASLRVNLEKKRFQLGTECTQKGRRCACSALRGGGEAIAQVLVCLFRIELPDALIRVECDGAGRFDVVENDVALDTNRHEALE
jgi:hypothetical protein